MSLATRYRPQDFDEVWGNEETVNTLQSMVQREDCPHAFLLTGITGVAKTTLARIIAQYLGAAGSDFREVDSAEFRGIDTIREMRQTAALAPMEGSVRVWVIDEVHQLSKDAQNALLKALEEPYNHVYYVLCTTEPGKLIATIKGRCSHHKLAALDAKPLTRLLKHVAEQEGTQIDREAIESIAEQAEGSPRNALQILETVLAADPDEREQAIERAGEHQAQAIELARALMQGKAWKAVAGILDGLRQEEPESVRRLVLSYCTSALLGKKAPPKAAVVMEQFEEPLYNTGFPGLVLASYRATFDDA